jgi:alkanesulfonate monooxygenase SsuD/methylene tetrahydromethanopterin reductase-like flavin-dependent oxidoreductase (luciferase family)
VAAALGLPFAFASHFAAAQMIPAVELYRARFKASPVAQIDRPHVMLGINIIAADTDAEASFLSSSGRQAGASLRAGTPTQLPPPSREWEKPLTPFDASRLEELQAITLIGSADTVRAAMAAFVERMQPDELIVLGQIYDHDARLRSHEIAAIVAG